MTDWIEIGKVVAPQGLKGEMRVLSYSDFPGRFLEPGQRWLRQTDKGKIKEPRAIAILRGRAIPGKNLYVVSLADVTTREQAEALRGSLLLVPASDRPPLEEGEFHVSDLVGLVAIHHVTRDAIGTVVDVFLASQTVLEVQLHHQPAPKPSKRCRKKPKPATVLIPFVEAIVPVVNLSQQQVEVLPLPGLLPDAPPDSEETPPDLEPGS